MKVTLGGKEYRYKDLEATHHQGERNCTVEYDSVTLSNKKVTLPVCIMVRNGKDGSILRSARLMNFKQLDVDVSGAEQAAKQFGGFTEDQHKYWVFRSKYWAKNSFEVEEEDIDTIQKLWEALKDNQKELKVTVGEKLKNLNVQMGLNLILGDVSGLERNYEQYLLTLVDNKLCRMVLLGRYGIIEAAMFQGRRNVAEKILRCWIDTVLKTHDTESILSFAKQQLAKNRLWTTAVFLEAFSNQRQCTIEALFEAQVLRCSALYELYEILQIDDIEKKGLIAKTQVDWVSSIGTKGLEKMIDDLFVQAKRTFVEINELTESQKALKEQLEKIEKEIKI